MMDREKVLNEWMDWCFQFLWDKTDDEYAILCYGVKSRKDLFLNSADHDGVANALLAIERALYKFFQNRNNITAMGIPKIKIEYVEYLFDRDRRIVLRINGGPEVLLRLLSIHGYPQSAPWSDASVGFTNGPYLSQGTDDPEDDYGREEWRSENEVPIIETGKFVHASDNGAIQAALLYSCCYSAHSARKSSLINKQRFTWGPIEDSVTSEETEKALRELADAFESIGIVDYYRKYRAISGPN